MRSDPIARIVDLLSEFMGRYATPRHADLTPAGLGELRRAGDACHRESGDSRETGESGDSGETGESGTPDWIDSSLSAPMSKESD